MTIEKEILRTTKQKKAVPKNRKGKSVPSTTASVPAEIPDEVDPDAIARGDMPMSLVGHLDELRTRAIKTFGTVFVIMLAGFFLSDYIIPLLNLPFSRTGLKLNVFTVLEGFTLRIKVAAVLGVLIGIPVILYQIWKFIEPAIHSSYRRFIRFSLIGSILFFFAGISFTYFVLVPYSIKFLLAFTPQGVQLMLNATEYFTFFFILSIGLGILYEIPILIMILTLIGIVSPVFLIKKRKYAFIIIFIVAAMLMPADILSQLLLSLPLILLYEVSIIISRLIVITRIKREMKK